MASTLHPKDGQTDDAPPPRFGQPMTRCECAELSFSEIQRRLAAEGLTLEEVARRTGCGSICTACLPDLRDHLGRG